MQAEKDDMPEYMKSRKQEGPWKMAAIMGVGAAIVFGGVSLFGKGFVEDAKTIKEGRKPLGEIAMQRSTQQSHTEKAEAVMPKAYEKQIWRSNEDVIITDKRAAFEKAPEPKRKQTTFNDRNYRPNGSVNVVSFNTTKSQDEELKAPIRKQKEIVVIGKKEDRWEWVCSFEGQDGSTEKRDCKSRLNLHNRNKGR